MLEINKVLKGVKKILRIGKAGFSLINLLVIILPILASTIAFSGLAFAVSSPVEESSYIVYQDGGTIYAKNGKTGEIDYSGTNAATVIQSSINALTGGGKISIKAGTYNISSTISITTGGLTLKGEGREVTWLTLANGANVTLINATASGGYQSILNIHDLSLNGNKAQNTAGIGLYIRDFVKVSIERASFIDCASDGVKIEGGADIVEILESQAGGNNGYGFDMPSISGLHTFGVLTNANQKSGMLIGGNDIVISTCFFDRDSRTESTTEGLLSINASATVKLIGNYFIGGSLLSTESKSHGVVVANSANVTIIGNRFLNPYLGGANVYSLSLHSTSDTIITSNDFLDDCPLIDSRFGIMLSGTSAYNSIYGNRISITNGKAISEYDTANNNSIFGNDVSGSGVTPKITQVGTNTKIWKNKGYATESSGTATVASGQTTVNVTHGLASTPARVLLTPTITTGGRYYWISAKSATTFTIRINSTYTSAITFDWRATVGEE